MTSALPDDASDRSRLPPLPAVAVDALEATTVDPNTPWQAQYAERLSRGINQGSSGARRAALTFALSLLALALLLLAVLTVVAVRG